MSVLHGAVISLEVGIVVMLDLEDAATISMLS